MFILNRRFIFFLKIVNFNNFEIGNEKLEHTTLSLLYYDNHKYYYVSKLLFKNNPQLFPKERKKVPETNSSLPADDIIIISNFVGGCSEGGRCHFSASIVCSHERSRRRRFLSSESRLSRNCSFSVEARNVTMGRLYGDFWW